MASAAREKSTFNFELASPAQVEVRSFEEHVVIPGEEGDFVVLPGHTRLVSNLRPGVVRVVRGSQDAHQIYVSGGYADIAPDSCTILVPEAIPVHQLKKNVLEDRLSLLQSDLEELSDDDDGIDDIKNEIIDVETKLSVISEV